MAVGLIPPRWVNLPKRKTKTRSTYWLLLRKNRGSLAEAEFDLGRMARRPDETTSPPRAVARKQVALYVRRAIFSFRQARQSVFSSCCSSGLEQLAWAATARSVYYIGNRARTSSHKKRHERRSQAARTRCHCGSTLHRLFTSGRTGSNTRCARFPILASQP